MPLPSTRMIHTRWSEHHQPAVTTSFNAAVTITDPTRTTSGVFDPDTGTWGPPVPHVIAGGPDDTNPDWQQGVPCRIQRMRSDQDVDQAGQNIPPRLYLIQLPADVPDIEVGHTATVTTAANDTHLVGEDLVATDIQHGSERFTRDVVWSHNQQPPEV